jgi:hypothetical protein
MSVTINNTTELLALRRKYSHVFHYIIETASVCLIDNRPQGDICEIVPHKDPKVGLEEFRGARAAKLVSENGTNERDKRLFPIMVHHSLRPIDRSH